MESTTAPMDLNTLDLDALLGGSSPLPGTSMVDFSLWSDLFGPTGTSEPTLAPQIEEEDDDEEAEELDLAALGTPAQGGATVCNNKTLQDARWPRELLEMSTVQLNRYLRKHPMSAAEETELKGARRRSKNRGYSKSLRERRKVARKQAENDHAESVAADEELQARIISLETENSQIRQEVSYMERQLAESFDVIARLEALLTRSGVALPPPAAALPTQASEPAQQ